jgi:hypothetical protein
MLSKESTRLIDLRALAILWGESLVCLRWLKVDAEGVFDMNEQN